jgi:hypothetical protein
MIGMPPPNRDRFLCAIAERVSPERVQAVFLFAPMRHGPVESGVAVLAVDPDRPNDEIVPIEDDAAPSGQDSAAAPDDAGVDEIATQADAVVHAEFAAVPAGSSSVSPRPVVLTARYRHTLKGPDRGKWEIEILEQADAPLITIEMVVRGVQQRLDDTADPERLGAAELRAALTEGVWTAPQR